jgi:hypothetical protein
MWFSAVSRFQDKANPLLAARRVRPPDAHRGTF